MQNLLLLKIICYFTFFQITVLESLKRGGALIGGGAINGENTVNTFLQFRLLFHEPHCNGRTNGPMDGRTDRPSYRDARTHLKTMANVVHTNLPATFYRWIQRLHRRCLRLRHRRRSDPWTASSREMTEARPQLAR